MKKFLYIFILLPLLASCAQGSYFIDGTSSLMNDGGNMAYIKEYRQTFSGSIDSCMVIHGHFQMSGPIDSAMCVGLYVGDGNYIPMVLENGDINVSIANTSVQVEGTPLNERLYNFLESRDSLMFLLSDLPRSQAVLFIQGYSPFEIQDALMAKQAEYQQAIERLEDKFIKDNYKNVLSVMWFGELIGEAADYYGYPVITPRLQALYKKAPRSFRRNPRIARYFK